MDYIPRQYSIKHTTRVYMNSLNCIDNHDQQHMSIRSNQSIHDIILIITPENTAHNFHFAVCCASHTIESCQCILSTIKEASICGVLTIRMAYKVALDVVASFNRALMTVGFSLGRF